MRGGGGPRMPPRGRPPRRRLPFPQWTSASPSRPAEEAGCASERSRFLAGTFVPEFPGCERASVAPEPEGPLSQRSPQSSKARGTAGQTGLGRVGGGGASPGAGTNAPLVPGSQPPHLRNGPAAPRSTCVPRGRGHTTLAAAAPLDSGSSLAPSFCGLSHGTSSKTPSLTTLHQYALPCVCVCARALCCCCC